MVSEHLGTPAGFKGRALKARQEAQELGMGGKSWTARVDSPTLAQTAGFYNCCDTLQTPFFATLPIRWPVRWESGD